jgi:hypothetical protein
VRLLESGLFQIHQPPVYQFSPPWSCLTGLCIAYLKSRPRSSRRRLLIFYPRRARLSVSFQITILKVLAGQAGGRAALPELTRQVSILVSSGSDWTDGTKRLSALAPGLDIFRSRFVFVDRANWQITDAGRAFLISLETPTSADNYSAITEDVIPPDATPPALPSTEAVCVKRRRSGMRCSIRARLAFSSPITATTLGGDDKVCALILRSARTFNNNFLPESN